MPTLSFITANYVARAHGYCGRDDWGFHDRHTQKTMTLSTWCDIVEDIKSAGFMAADLWTAHCHPQMHTTGYRDALKEVCDQSNLSLSSMCGGLVLDTPKDAEPMLAWMNALGISTFGGGLWGALAKTEFAPAMNDVFARHKVRWAFENHPEKTADDILRKTGGGKYKQIGVALDTGWCGTQAMDALDTVKRLRDNLFLLHLKDVKSQGGHDTCTLGDGVVGIEKIVRYLKETKFDGTICIEHEPYDHDPMPDVIESVKRFNEWWG
jgi:sugar phosphate isomerase/epimerase